MSMIQLVASILGIAFTVVAFGYGTYLLISADKVHEPVHAYKRNIDLEFVQFEEEEYEEESKRAIQKPTKYHIAEYDCVAQ